jgi:hypothetical protein
MKNYAAFVVFAAALTLGTNSFAGKPAEVNEKVIRSFNQTFPFAEDVKWQEFTDRYTVNFAEGSIKTIVNYDKDGNFLGATRYYGSEILPLNILCKIKKKYPGKKIFGVTEISTAESIDYYIKLEDDVNWVTVKSDASGSFETVEKYKKQR